MSFETLYLGYEMTFEKIWKVSKTTVFKTSDYCLLILENPNFDIEPNIGDWSYRIGGIIIGLIYKQV